MNAEPRRSRNVLGWVLLLIAMWFAVASVVFQVRHPWATDTERSFHFDDALLFRRVTVQDVRPSTD